MLEEGAAAIEHARALCAATQARRAQWGLLVAGVRERETQTMRGGSDADIVTAIRGATLCWRCVALKVGLAPDALHEAMVAVGRNVAIATDLGACDDCQCETLLYRLA